MWDIALGAIIALVGGFLGFLIASASQHRGGKN